MSDLIFMPLETAANLMRKRELSPVEYVEALIRHTEAIDGNLHAYFKFCPDTALRDARAAEGKLLAGGGSSRVLGVPYGLKDVIDYAGMPTTAGSAVFENSIAAAHAQVTQKLVASGAVMMGKMATHELAIGGPSDDLPWPVPVNPWADNHFAGGSSSGSAVAVAAGMLPIAIGTDTGGSVRSPAANCGVVGIKPTYGLINVEGVMPLSPSFDTVGVLSRHVRDNAVALETIAQPALLKRADGGSYQASVEKGIKGLKIGLVRHFYAEDEKAHPEQIVAIDRAAEQFSALGAEVREIRLPPKEDYSACVALIVFPEAFALYRNELTRRPEEFGVLARSSLFGGATVTAVDYLDAQRWRARLSKTTMSAMNGLDALLTSTNFDPAYSLDDSGAVARAIARQTRHVFSVTGQPAISLPAGFTSSGLPLSLQIAGRHFDESTVYRIASAYEEASNWNYRRPPLAEALR